MVSAIFRIVSAGTAFLVSPTVAQADIENILGNWDILYQSLEIDFQGSAASEFTLDYLIGTGRSFTVDLFDSGCADPITGLDIVHTEQLFFSLGPDDVHDRLEVGIDLDKTGITSSNIWTDPKLEFCIQVQLLSGGSVIKEE